MARDVVSAVLLSAGGLFCLLGAVGLLRFPETVSRLHATAKAQTLGLLLILLGTAAQLAWRYAFVLALIALFQLVTVPVTGQIVGRTAYRTNPAVRRGLLHDDLRARVGAEPPAREDEDRPDGDEEADGEPPGEPPEAEH
ncbi:monovalent cation/H(+) antiporter subunit G [Streptomyces sp. JJ36]|nr:monovalent cation/H(+) antiporter subunit G [Streptomyces sp. JJ36]